MSVPPKEAREAAALGLELRERFGRGGTEVGAARAWAQKEQERRRMKTLTSRGRGQVALAATPSPHLPPLPADRLGRYSRWLLVTDEDGYEAVNLASGAWERVEVGEAEMDRLVAEYERMCEGGYQAPLQAEHDGKVTLGMRLGDIVSLAKWRDPDSGKLKLIAAVGFAIPDAEARIANGQIRYVSPGFGSWTDEKGRRFENVFLELSLTTHPQQASKGEHVLAAHPESPMEDLVKQLVEGQKALQEELAALKALMAKPEEAKPEEAKPEEVEMAAEGEDPKVAQLAAELKATRTRQAELERVVAKKTFEAEYPEGATVTLTPELRDACFELCQSNPTAFSKLAAKAQRPASPPASPPSPSGSSPNWGSKLSSGAAPDPTPTPTTLKALSAQASKLADEQGGTVRDHYNKLYLEAVKAGTKLSA